MVAVGFEQKNLKPDLHAIGRPRFHAVDRGLAGLVLVGDLGLAEREAPRAAFAVLDGHGRRRSGVAGRLRDLGKVEPGGELKLFAGQVERTHGTGAFGIFGRGGGFVVGLLGIDAARTPGHEGRLINTPVGIGTFFGVGRGDEHALDLHVVKEAWAVGVLADVAGAPEGEWRCPCWPPVDVDQDGGPMAYVVVKGATPMQRTRRA